VFPGELKVIETYLAAVVDDSLEPMGLDTEKLEASLPNALGNSQKVHKQLLAGAQVIATMVRVERRSRP
jgi:hypothetical protein